MPAPRSLRSLLLPLLASRGGCVMGNLTSASTSRTVVSMAAATAPAAGAPAGLSVATVAGGCFWCIEAVYSQMKGVESAVSGYTGGRTDKPTYKEVCDGDTGHAEAVRITFDPAVLSYGKLLDVFFTIHDPTTLNRQGADAGTQYRSAIFYHTEEQKAAAEALVAELAPHYKSPIVTEVVPAPTWYDAEDHHQHFFERNPGHGYCRAVVSAKVLKARTKFSELLK
jgi:peptide-methionine (S)-S-oxide reductase